MVGTHAVVLGASMAGLLAARVLAEFYESVTVVERDELPDAAANEQLIRVTGLIDPPTRLFRPKLMYRVARARPPR